MYKVEECPFAANAPLTDGIKISECLTHTYQIVGPPIIAISLFFMVGEGGLALMAEQYRSFPKKTGKSLLAARGRSSFVCSCRSSMRGAFHSLSFFILTVYIIFNISGH